MSDIGGKYTFNVKVKKNSETWSWDKKENPKFSLLNKGIYKWNFSPSTFALCHITKNIDKYNPVRWKALTNSQALWHQPPSSVFMSITCAFPMLIQSILTVHKKHLWILSTGRVIHRGNGIYVNEFSREMVIFFFFFFFQKPVHKDTYRTYSARAGTLELLVLIIWTRKETQGQRDRLSLTHEKSVHAAPQHFITGRE